MVFSYKIGVYPILASAIVAGILRSLPAPHSAAYTAEAVDTC
jgi:hypothetical protein